MIREIDHRRIDVIGFLWCEEYYACSIRTRSIETMESCRIVSIDIGNTD
jgi:hypothetical protein